MDKDICFGNIYAMAFVNAGVSTKFFWLSITKSQLSIRSVQGGDFKTARSLFHTKRDSGISSLGGDADVVHSGEVTGSGVGVGHGPGVCVLASDGGFLWEANLLIPIAISRSHSVFGGTFLKTAGCFCRSLFPKSLIIFFDLVVFRFLMSGFCMKNVFASSNISRSSSDVISNPAVMYSRVQFGPMQV